MEKAQTEEIKLHRTYLTSAMLRPSQGNCLKQNSGLVKRIDWPSKTNPHSNPCKPSGQKAVNQILPLWPKKARV